MKAVHFDSIFLLICFWCLLTTDVKSSEHVQLQNEDIVGTDSDKVEDSLGDKTEAMATEQDRPEQMEQAQSNRGEINSHLDDEKLAPSDEVKSSEPDKDIDPESENIALSAKCGIGEGEPADQMIGGSEEGSLTPPLAAHDTDNVDLTADMCTPQREACALPTKLFTRENQDPRLEADEMLSLDTSKEECKKNDVPQEYGEDTKQNELVESALPVELLSEQATVPVPTQAVVTVEDNTSDKDKFCDCLRSLKELASPEVLRELSSEEIFEAHHNLTEVMSVVVQALRGRWQSPRSKKQLRT